MTPLLHDKVFISTRPKDESDELPYLLTAEGATVIELPLIEIKAKEITDDEKKYFSEIATFNWIVFTSANGVRFFFEQLKAITGSFFLNDSIQLAVIGTKTKQVLQSFGYNASFVNPGSTAEDFTEPFLLHIRQEGTNPAVLLPLGNMARTTIQDYLKEAARCIRIDLYKTEFPEQTDQSVIAQIEENRYDMILFTSPSGVQNFLKAMPSLNKKKIRMACIGAITYRKALEYGFNPLVIANKSSAEGMVQSIINYYISKK